MSDSELLSTTSIVPTRAVHLDLKGVPPTPQRLISLLDVFAAGGYNAILVEWEDCFPWEVDHRFRGPDCYSSEEISRFVVEARARGIEVIPLVQCLGHMETVLSVSGFERFREVPGRCDVLNVLTDGATELILRMVRDVLDKIDGITRFHLGGDEAWTFGSHPATKAFVEQHSKGELYLQHVQPLMDELHGRGIRPLLWHDMMAHWSDAELKQLGAAADLVVWGYGGDPARHFRQTMQRFAANGVRMWGAGAYKGADGADADLPNLAGRMLNVQGWANLAGEFHLQGLIATAWSRYSTHRMQCEPIDGALDSLLMCGGIFHNGKTPERETVLRVLEAIGERPRFEACHGALRSLAERRQGLYRVFRELSAHLAGAQNRHPARPTSGVYEMLCGWYNGELAGVCEACKVVRRTFDALVQPHSLDEYIAERSADLLPLIQPAAK